MKYLLTITCILAIVFGQAATDKTDKTADADKKAPAKPRIA
jgi:hypothetical protein